MSYDEQLEKAQREVSVSVKSRDEPVPQPKGQSASRLERLSTQPSADRPPRPRASRSSYRGRGIGLFFVVSLFFRFSVLVSRELSRSRRCAVATSTIRGVSRGGCAASPRSGKVPPDWRGQWYQEHRAPTQEPRIPQYVVRSWVLPYSFTGGMFWVFGSLLNQP